MRIPTYALFVLPDEITAVSMADGKKMSLPLSAEMIRYGEILDAAAYEKIITDNFSTFFVSSGDCVVVLHESFGFVENAAKPLRNILRRELFNLAAYAPISEDKLAFTGFTETKTKDSKVRKVVFLSSTLIMPVAAVLKKARIEISAVLPLSLLPLSSGDLKQAFTSLNIISEDSDNIIRYAHNVTSELVLQPVDPVVVKREKKKHIFLITLAAAFILAAILYSLYASGVFSPEDPSEPTVVDPRLLE